MTSNLTDILNLDRQSQQKILNVKIKFLIVYSHLRVMIHDNSMILSENINKNETVSKLTNLTEILSDSYSYGNSNISDLGHETFDSHG